jgi:mannose-6-phosphate isomerase
MVTDWYPLRLCASLHKTIWGGRGLERDGWKQLPPGDIAIGESWETEIGNIVQNGPYAGKTLGTLVGELGVSLLGTQAFAVFGRRFPLLAKFISANARLSVQVHPGNDYAAQHENGKLGKTEFWYILSAEPGARIVYGFKTPTNRAEVAQAIQNVTLDCLLHEESVQAGDVIYVPAGTVHAIGSGIILYELQEYSDITYRMYDYGRLSATGQPRELHIQRSLDVANYAAPRQIKVQPIPLANPHGYEDRCLIACRYFLTRELQLKEHITIDEITQSSCIIITCLGAQAHIFYGDSLKNRESISRGETIVLPAALERYRLSGTGPVLLSYVPESSNEVWTGFPRQRLFYSP